MVVIRGCGSGSQACRALRSLLQNLLILNHFDVDFRNVVLGDDAASQLAALVIVSPFYCNSDTNGRLIRSR